MKFEYPKTSARWSNKPKGPPKRTFKEMAEEFGVTSTKLSALIIHRNGPKPIKLGSGETQNTWCDAEATRAWWKAIHETN